MSEMGSQLKLEAGNGERSRSWFSEGMSHPAVGSDTAPAFPLGALNQRVGTSCLGKKSGWRGQKRRVLKCWDVNKAGGWFFLKKNNRSVDID